uniref:Serpin family B member 11 n=1 Tax=Pseudonaja textilis TaxID=8673 RepID=A0A670ZUW2_PSETE
MGQSLSKAITAFALDLYNSLNSNKLCKNVFFSPASISMALGMVLIGASGTSKMQIEKVSKTMTGVPDKNLFSFFGGPGRTIYSEFKQLLLQLNNLSHGYQLKLANNLFMQKGYQFLQNETKPVHMMYQQGRFKLGHTDGKSAQILCLPYVDELLSMIIILPNDISQLEQNLASWLSPGNLRERPVEIYIPRFRLEAGYDLNLTLQALGLIDVFSEAKADLLGMSPSPQLFLSTVVHKAYVDINEVGTEAAAATGVAVSNRSLEHHELFLADHPFLFCILHNPTDTVLFLGKVCCP